MKTNTIRISRESYLTSNGTHTHSNCRPVIIPELQMVINSRLDVAEKLGVSYNTVINTLQGKRNTCPIWEKDENGNRRKVGYCHLYEASDYESAMEMVMECGRKANDELSKANARLAETEKKASTCDSIQSTFAHLNQLKAKREKIDAEIADAERKLSALLEGK